MTEQERLLTDNIKTILRREFEEDGDFKVYENQVDYEERVSKEIYEKVYPIAFAAGERAGIESLRKELADMHSDDIPAILDSLDRHAQTIVSASTEIAFILEAAKKEGAKALAEWADEPCKDELHSNFYDHKRCRRCWQSKLSELETQGKVT